MVVGAQFETAALDRDQPQQLRHLLLHLGRNVNNIVVSFSLKIDFLGDYYILLPPVANKTIHPRECHQS